MPVSRAPKRIRGFLLFCLLLFPPRLLGLTHVILDFCFACRYFSATSDFDVLVFFFFGLCKFMYVYVFCAGKGMWGALCEEWSRLQRMKNKDMLGVVDASLFSRLPFTYVVR